MEYITLNLSAQSLNIIGAALSELPYKVANPVIQEIDKQVKTYIEARNGRASESSPGGPADKAGDSNEQIGVPSGVREGDSGAGNEATA